LGKIRWNCPKHRISYGYAAELSASAAGSYQLRKLSQFLKGGGGNLKTTIKQTVRSNSKIIFIWDPSSKLKETKIPELKNFAIYYFHSSTSVLEACLFKVHRFRIFLFISNRQNYDRGFSIKDVHTPPVRREFVQCGHFAVKGWEGVLDADVRTFWYKNHRIFRNSCCVRTDKWGWASAVICGQGGGGQFFAILCGRLLWTTPLTGQCDLSITAISQTGDQLKKRTGQKKSSTVTHERPDVLLFNAGCNEQVFSLNSEKNWAQIRLLLFSRKTQKRTFNSETWRHRAEG